MDQSEIINRPNVIPWPPVLLFASAAIGAPLTYYWPLLYSVPPWSSASFGAGIALAITAIVIYVWSERTLARAKTNILPHKPALQLVTDGPFRFSRNPIYVANTILLLAGALIFTSPWLVLLAGANAYLLHHLAILREERHLAARFGAEWHAYARRTPRWIGPV